MKNRLFMFAVLGLTLGAFAVGMAVTAEEKAVEKKAASQPASKPAVAVNKICAVEGGDHTVDPEFFTMYKGLKIGFCCKDCIAEFDAEPEKYIAKLKARGDGVK